MRLPTRLLQRRPEAHKGDFGHVFILAGSWRFSGAALLCAEAAMRCGAGMVTLAAVKSLIRALVKVKPKEVMLLPLPETREGTFSLSAYREINKFLKGVDVVVIGPGLTVNRSTQQLVRKLAGKIDKLAVIDADGLNALVGHLGKLNGKVITPHPGELSRLLGVPLKNSAAERKAVAKRFARYYNVTIVLKGNQSVVADPEGNLYVNRTGNPGMATAGSGDVLAGMIAAFLGQGLPPFTAVKSAVYLHGLAGDLAAKEKTQISLIASDIIAKIPAAIKKNS